MFGFLESIKSIFFGIITAGGLIAGFLLKRKNDKLKEFLNEKENELKDKENELVTEKVNRKAEKEELRNEIKVKEFESKVANDEVGKIKKENEVKKEVKDKADNTPDGVEYEINL